jgi:subtilase family serine protease
MRRNSHRVSPASSSLSFRHRRRPGGPARRRSIRLHPEQLEDRITPTTYLMPAQIRDYYGINSIPAFQSNGSSVTADGTGQTIAIIDPYNDPDILLSAHLPLISPNSA